VVSRSNTESEYMVVKNLTLELVWIIDLLTEIDFSQSVSCDYI